QEKAVVSDRLTRESLVGPRVSPEKKRSQRVELCALVLLCILVGNGPVADRFRKMGNSRREIEAVISLGAAPSRNRTQAQGVHEKPRCACEGKGCEQDGDFLQALSGSGELARPGRR